MRIQREELQANIALFGGLEGLIENKDKYKVLVSENLYNLSQKM